MKSVRYYTTTISITYVCIYTYICLFTIANNGATILTHATIDTSVYH